MGKLAVSAKRLHELQPGESGTVVSLGGEPGVRWRLVDLGLVPGTVVEVLRSSPLGDPTLYRFRGTMIALRARDAAGVLVEPLTDRSGAAAKIGREAAR